MIETSFYTWLAAQVSQSVYPGMMPQGAAPAVVYSKADDSRDRVYGGNSTLQAAEFNVDCYSVTYTEARTMAQTITAALVNYRGAMDTDHCDNAELVTDLDTYEPETKLHRAALRFRILYRL